jgi:hypothetical protein
LAGVAGEFARLEDVERIDWRDGPVSELATVEVREGEGRLEEDA